MTAASPREFRALTELSVVIPALNAATTIADCLDALREAQGAEIIIVDGGSYDDTVAIASRHAATVVQSPRGRGVQLRAGAARAGRPWLLFLHADTRLERQWSEAVEKHMTAFDAARRAAAFRFRLDDDDWRARLLEKLVGVRVQLFSLPYGDQGLLIHRSLYELIGGYANLALMEDVDLIRRLGTKRLTVLEASAITSAERWRRDGWMRRSARNLVCLALFHLGVPPQQIARLYER